MTQLSECEIFLLFFEVWLMNLFGFYDMNITADLRDVSNFREKVFTVLQYQYNMK